MGTIRTAEKVLLISAICYSTKTDMESVMGQIENLCGPIDTRSRSFAFIHTHYYQKEMGDNLFKFYCTFKNLIDPMDIVDIKLATNDIEDQFSSNGQRNVNIDPGYIEVPKLVLATTKNFGHRIYLGKGIYGDVQFIWKQGAFQPNPWTYPDYMITENLDYFINARTNYFNHLQKGVS